MIRRTTPGWERRVRTALKYGAPFKVACHDDPVPKLQELAQFRRGSGYGLSDELFAEFNEAVTNARAEGHPWWEIGVMLGADSTNRPRAVSVARGFARPRRRDE